MITHDQGGTCKGKKKSSSQRSNTASAGNSHQEDDGKGKDKLAAKDHHSEWGICRHQNYQIVQVSQ